MRARTVGLALVAISAVTPAWAEGWMTTTADDGVWFQASAMLDARQVVLECGGRSPRGYPVEQSQVAEPVVTGKQELRVSVAPDLLGIGPAPGDVFVVAKLSGHTLRTLRMRYDEMRGHLATDLPADADLLAALGAGQTITLSGNDAATDLAVAGAGRAVTEVLSFCTERWDVAQTAAKGPLNDKIVAYLEAYAGNLDVEIDALSLEDLNDDGTPEALVILGGAFCGSRYCDGFVLDLTGAEARKLGQWMVATLRPASSKLNGWRDLEVNGARARFDGERYE